MLNAIDDGVYFLDPLGNTVFVNEAAARLLGHTAREMLGKPQHELIHHHYPDGTVFPREACPIYLSATEGIPQRVGGDVFWRKDGTPLHVDYTSIPIRERRQIVGVVVTFRDISAQQRAEEQEARLTKERAARAEAERARQSLLVSDQRYRALVEAAGQYVWTNSPEGRPARVARWQGCGDAFARYSGADTGGVQRGVQGLADEAGEAARAGARARGVGAGSVADALSTAPPRERLLVGLARGGRHFRIVRQ